MDQDTNENEPFATALTQLMPTAACDPAEMLVAVGYDQAKREFNVHRQRDRMRICAALAGCLLACVSGYIAGSRQRSPNRQIAAPADQSLDHESGLTSPETSAATARVPKIVSSDEIQPAANANNILASHQPFLTPIRAHGIGFDFDRIKTDSSRQRTGTQPRKATTTNNRRPLTPRSEFLPENWN